MDLVKNVVKIKKLQMLGDNLAILIPKGWSNALDWTRETKLILEFLPHRQMMILSKKPTKTKEALELEEEAEKAASDIVDIKDEKNSDIVAV